MGPICLVLESKGKDRNQSGISWQGRTEKKGPAKVLENKRAIGPFLNYLKSTDVGGREGAKGRDVDWERRNYPAGEEYWAWAKGQTEAEKT